MHAANSLLGTRKKGYESFRVDNVPEPSAYLNGVLMVPAWVLCGTLQIESSAISLWENERKPTSLYQRY